MTSTLPGADRGRQMRLRVLRSAVALQAVLCVLLGFSIIVVWINYRHNLVLSELALEHQRLTDPAVGGAGREFAVAVTIPFVLALTMTSCTLYPIWRGSLMASTISSLGTIMLAAMSGLLSVVLWFVRPFDGYDGDWDLNGTEVTRQYGLLARQDPMHWYQWALLSLPMLAVLALLTGVLHIRCVTFPRMPTEGS